MSNDRGKGGAAGMSGRGGKSALQKMHDPRPSQASRGEIAGGRNFRGQEQFDREGGFENGEVDRDVIIVKLQMIE